MKEKIEEVQLIAIREGTYTMYVFKRMEDMQYIMCTKLPNWQTSNISIGDIGFLQYQIVKAGETYYNPNTDTSEKYLYSNIYFINFIHKSDVINKKSIII